jgi:hypothetical protein
MKTVPTVIVTGEASFRATHDHCASKFLTQAGVLNTHMMMLESNSAGIAGVIADWLEKNVK